MCSSCTSGNSRCTTRSHTSRHRREVSSTLALSIDSQPSAAAARELRGDAHDALDLGAPCRCTGRVACVRIARLRAEVDAAGQLAHEHQVDALDDLGLERRGVAQRRVHAAPGAGWRTRPSSRAQPQQARLGPHLAPAATTTSGRRSRRAAPRRPRQASSVVGRQRIAVRIDRDAAEGGRRRARIHGRSERAIACSTAHRLGDDLRADAIAGQHRDLRLHAAGRARRRAISASLREQEAELIDAVEQAVARKRLDRKVPPRCRRAERACVRSRSIVISAPGMREQPGGRGLIDHDRQQPVLERSCCGRCRRSRC